MASLKFTGRGISAAICGVLVVVTLILYWPLGHHDFINIDDQRFVTENPHTQAGLTWAGIAWAFQSLQTENWHPLTWLSHELDCTLFGLNAGEHHLTSLFFHILNTLLVFVFLRNASGAIWLSAFVAALFAWHPLHVESVAWISERKDVLSTFFWLLALITYWRFVQTTKVTGRAAKSSAGIFRPPVSGFYWLTLFFFGCGLMSKPMVVTLPFVLLLLDFWPLQRMPDGPWQPANILRLGMEKIPFLVLAAVASAVTVVAQKAGGALMPLAAAPVSLRLENSLLAYIGYISKLFWPVKLAVFYPYSYAGDKTIFLVIAAIIFLVSWTGLFVLVARTRPYLLVGWLWFLGTLIPTIGLVQVGLQSIADRYAYIPSIGLFIVVIWGLHDFAIRRPVLRKLLSILGGMALAACLAVTSIQIGYWQDSLSLGRHAVEVTRDNFVAYDSIGRVLTKRGQIDEALPFFAEAVRVEPRFLQSQISLAIVLQNRGRPAEAIPHLAAAAKLAPTYAEVQYNLGLALLQAGNFNDAADQFDKTLRLKPDDVMAYYCLAIVSMKRGEPAPAIAQFRQALRLQPDFADALNALARLRATAADPALRSGPEAVSLAKHACELTGFQEAVCLTTLSLAYAEDGQFTDAIAAAQKARDLALTNRQKEIADEDDKLIKLFEAGQPFHESF